MGTSNFHTANAGATYVIDYGDDEFAWQDCQEYLGELIKSLDSSFELDDSIESKQELRSFPTFSIGYWENGLTFLNLTFDFRVNLFIRSGYYEAACLDYEFEWFLDGDYYDNFPDIIHNIDCDPELYNIKPGLWKIHKERLEGYLHNLQNKLIEQVEEILPQISTPYRATIQFSNGETMYEKK